MAAASNKKTTKEKVEVIDNNKIDDNSVLESTATGKNRKKASNGRQTKRTVQSAKKNTNTSNKRKSAEKVNITYQRKIQDVTEYRDRLAFETGITLIVIGIIAIFLYVSFFGLGGIVGRVFGGLCFGVFGWAAWFIPLGIFLGYIFIIVNKGDRRVPRKITGILGMFVCLEAITDLITKKEIITEYYTSNHVLHHGYFECMNLTLEDVLESGKSSGGLIGRCISTLLSSICGDVGACILLFSLLILCLFIFEGIELMAALRKRNAYRQEMEQLYGEVKDKVEFREPSYTVLRSRTTVKPFGNAEKEETDIREKYKRVRNFDNKTSDKQDYVEKVRQNSQSKMPSVDLKVMSKFLDEQKLKNSKSERKTEDNKENKKTDNNKSENKENNKTSKADNKAGVKIYKENTVMNKTDTVNKEKEQTEPIPIFREEMNQKFGRNRTRLYEPAAKMDNEKSNMTNEVIDSEIHTFDDKYEPEIMVAGESNNFTQEKEDNTDVENVINEKIIDDTDVEDKRETNSDAVFIEPKEVTGEDDAVFIEPEEVTEEISGDIDMYFANTNRSARCSASENERDTYEKTASKLKEVSYKKPEKPDKHGKFGGDDYVSASEAFNALNETKISEPVIERAYAFPPIELLGEPVHNNDSLSDSELRETAEKLQETLKSFNVDVKMGAVTCGPTVTRYELLPEQGVRVNKITNLTDDIKLSLAAQSVRIEAPIPGKSAVGIEVPNPTPSSVYFRELLAGEAFEKAKSPLTFAVGKDISGKLILTDIGKMPHLLIAGATGSGKSVCINTLVMSILYKSDPNDVKLIMIDPKVVELSVYNGIPHLMCPVVTDPKEAAATLNWAVREMSDRYNKFTELGVRNIAGYNEKIQKVDNPEKAGYGKMPYIVVIVDEFADLMMVASKDVEDAVCRLAQLARAAGIHLVLATQRPSVNVITGTIKANIPSRIAFSVSSAIDSRTILDRGGAEKLLGKGDMLFFPSGHSEPVRVQGAFVTDEEVSKVVDFLRDNNEKPEYNDKVTQIVEEDTKETEKDAKPERDEYFEDAGRFVIESDRAAAGQLQRRFSIGFNRAGRIIDQLHKAGVVGPAEGTKPRKILMTKNEFEMMLGNAPEPVSNEEIDAITEEFGQQ